ncbi:MAG: TetR/AcrR family transcriptional regulator [Myxococcales bacterium]|nr:TetR/AcrR family transcriptional regulator [Myxococcales bacterium]
MPSESGRPRDPEVDERILEAARELLREGGVDQLTITAVASRAGVGRPTIYRRYDRPQQIAMHVLYDDLDQLVGTLAEAQDHDAPVLEQLMALATPILGYYASNPSLSKALLQLGLFAPEAWRKRFGTQATEWLGGLARGLEAAKGDGRLHADVNTLLLMQTFFSLYLTMAIGGTQGALGGLDAQLSLLRAALTQHLRGLVPGT